MAPKERLEPGCICFAYQGRPEISTQGSIIGSTKDVVNMEWLNADDLAVLVDKGADAPEDITLAPFMAISLHENHFIGLPLIKVPYTMTFNKTCERAERVDRTYLAISPSENTVKLKNKRIDNRFRPLQGTNFPVQKIYKDPKTGRPMPEWDTFIDFAVPIYIKFDQIEWHAEIYKTPVPETLRMIRLFRFVQSLDYDIPDVEEMDGDGQVLDLADRDRTQRRPVEWIGPGVRNDKQGLTPPSSSELAKRNQKAALNSVNYVNNPNKGPNNAPQGNPVGINTWANIAGGSNAAHVGQNQKYNNQQGQQSRGGGSWGQNKRGGWGNESGAGQRDRRGGQNGGRGQYRGRGNQRGGGKWGNNGRNSNDDQKNGQQWGQQNKTTQNDNGKSSGELKIPENGKLAGLEKEVTLAAKMIPDIEEEKPAPVAELLALANEKTTQMKKPSLTQAAKEIGEKDKYDFAAFVRNRDREKQAKLGIVAEEKDSAQCISDNDRTTWNKGGSKLVKEPWPEDWEIAEPGKSIFDNIKDIPTREGWDFQKPNIPWWVRCQEWLGLEGEDRVYKGWEYPDDEALWH
ncbi:hypothetical protein AOL_s00215g428 [Orbilia oligospora ATCC 24927]|uniref:Uncharacterized protein n=2 Tax=Orbilia oligospora TaxID=2813651 RepID=G1XST0_ARTOA|nr:hypothetical protein AOL_s00215g428 [Orbilia oligospora ATCC 24927]EGX43692.1 hypothetical protein AOL_s00215g428 [Orbilia oligospora ATCC 24927]KAF3273085.1 hypothetical protein TWF970_009375 [Orbilia oligospora]